MFYCLLLPDESSLLYSGSAGERGGRGSPGAPSRAGDDRGDRPALHILAPLELVQTQLGGSVGTELRPQREAHRHAAAHTQDKPVWHNPADPQPVRDSETGEANPAGP